MIYTLKDDRITLFGLDAKDINAVRRYIYWKMPRIRIDIWKGRRMLGYMEYVNGWKYWPSTESDRFYHVTGHGTLIGEDYLGDC